MKLVIIAGVVALTTGAYAWCCPPPHHYHCHGGYWGRGGCYFWPGFAGGVIGGLAYNALAAPAYRETVVVQSTPTVVTQPVVAQQPVVVQQPAVVQQPVVVQQPAVVQQPVVVQQPAAVQQAAPASQMQNVWIEGQYIDQVQANGTTSRVWNPGHYEQRAVVTR